MLLFILKTGYLILNTISEMNILLHFILTVHVYNFKIMCKSSEKQSELLVKVPTGKRQNFNMQISSNAKSDFQLKCYVIMYRYISNCHI